MIYQNVDVNFKLIYQFFSKRQISGIAFIWLTKNQWHESVETRSKDSALLYIMSNAQ